MPLGLIIILVLTALLANVLTPYSPVDISLPDRLRPPFWEQGGEPGAPTGHGPDGPGFTHAPDLWGAYFAARGLSRPPGRWWRGSSARAYRWLCRGRLDALLMRVTDTTLFPSFSLRSSSSSFSVAVY